MRFGLLALSSGARLIPARYARRDGCQRVIAFQLTALHVHPLPDASGRSVFRSHVFRSAGRFSPLLFGGRARRFRSLALCAFSTVSLCSQPPHAGAASPGASRFHTDRAVDFRGRPVELPRSLPVSALGHHPLARPRPTLLPLLSSRSRPFRRAVPWFASRALRPLPDPACLRCSRRRLFPAGTIA